MPYLANVRLPVAAVPANLSVTLVDCMTFVATLLLLNMLIACPYGLTNTLAGTVTFPELMLTKLPASDACSV